MRADHCGPDTRRPYKCPDREDLFRAFIMLLPRGRAWQTHDDGVPRDQSWLQRYWWAVAGESVVLWQSICSMTDQYFCDTVTYMRDELLADYGLPDECDPYGDICTRIAAYGDYGCEHWTAIAAAHGWDIVCSTFEQSCCGQAGHARAGYMECNSSPSWLNSQINITINIATSTAYDDDPCLTNCVGYATTGWARACEISPDSLICLLEKTVPAHVQLNIGTN
ncbi:MAG: hypothetical protein COB93_00250 [Sneathiella sp.]|nr:MAG: hypothetical protein COB93_00250 [Sneathiella sp.]